jgi:hypothetical protein
MLAPLQDSYSCNAGCRVARGRCFVEVFRRARLTTGTGSGQNGRAGAWKTRTGFVSE